MTFLPFPIYDFRSGLNLSVEPFKTPQDSFNTLNNIMIRRGLLRKRNGQSVFGQTGKYYEEEGFSNKAGDEWTKTATNKPIIPHSVIVYDQGAGTQIAYDVYSESTYPVGTFTGDATGTVNYTTGEISIEFAGALVGGLVVKYHYDVDEDARCIKQFDRYSGGNLLVGFQQNRMSRWNPTYKYFENIPGTITSAAFDTGDGGKNYGHTLTNTPLVRGSVVVTDSVGAQVLTDNSLGGFAGDGTGNVNYNTGVISVAFTANVGIGNAVVVTYQCYNFWDSTNLVWTHAYNDKLWIADNTTYDTSGQTPQNGIRYFDGATIKDPIADDSSLRLDVAGAELIKGALIVFTSHERVVMLNTVEGASSTHYPQRAAWSWVGNPLNTDAWRRDTAGKGNYVDAPTNEEIVSFSFFGNIPIVGFENSVWALDYIGDPNLPFTWRRIAGFKDVSATFSGIEYVDSAAFLGGKGLIASNGSSCDNFDKIIPDFVYDIDIDNIGKAYSGRNDVLDQIWMSYPSAPNTSKNNSVLVFNYEDKSFSKYNLPAYCYGNWVESSDKTFADYSGSTIASLAGVKWGDRSMQAGYPVLLSGGTHGYIYACNDENANTDVTDWAGTSTMIDLLAISGRLNPFITKGVEVLIQQVGFFVTRLENAEFSVDFYVDEDIEPAYTAIIDCSEGEGDKTWVFADCVASGQFIKMRIYLSDAQKADSNIPLQQIEIHGFLFWMKPGAKIKQ